MEKSKTRLRAPNFTREDDGHLLNVVDKYKLVIKNKKTDEATLEDKNQTWAAVAEEYNSSTRTYARTAESLQQHYKNLKKKAKKTISTAKMCIPVPKNNLNNNLKESIGDKFKALADDKMELVKSQNELTSITLKLEKEKLANVLIEREILNIKKLHQEEMLAHFRNMCLAELEKSKMGVFRNPFS